MCPCSWTKTFTVFLRQNFDGYRVCELLWERFTVSPRNLSNQSSHVLPVKTSSLFFLQFPKWKLKFAEIRAGLLCRNQSRDKEDFFAIQMPSCQNGRGRSFDDIIWQVPVKMGHDYLKISFFQLRDINESISISNPDYQIKSFGVFFRFYLSSYSCTFRGHENIFSRSFKFRSGQFPTSVAISWAMKSNDTDVS